MGIEKSGFLLNFRRDKKIFPVDRDSHSEGVKAMRMSMNTVDSGHRIHFLDKNIFCHFPCLKRIIDLFDEEGQFLRFTR